MKKDKQVLEMLKQDMDKRDIPDFWDKIQEKRQTSLPPPKLAFHQTSQSTNNILKLLSIVAAAVFIFSVIPAIIINIITGTSFNFDFLGGKCPTEPPPDKAFNYSHVHYLEQKQFYGLLVPSTKTPHELSQFLSSLHNDEKVYEDDNYIYKFDKIGTLAEMVCIHNITSSAELSQEEIEKITDNILDTYFYMFSEIHNVTTKTISQNDKLVWNIDFIETEYAIVPFDSFYITYTTTCYYGIHIELSPDGQIIKLELLSYK